jgi:hypothetical protein
MRFANNLMWGLKGIKLGIRFSSVKHHFECIAQMGNRINVGIKLMWLLLNKDLENLGFGSGKQRKLGESIMARHIDLGNWHH